jgi:hypothetical protein
LAKPFVILGEAVRHPWRSRSSSLAKPFVILSEAKDLIASAVGAACGMKRH